MTTPARGASVNALIEEGIRLREQGRDEEALARFREAYDASQQPRALAQIGLALQALGRWVEAEEALSSALETGGPWVDRRRRPLTDALETIRNRLAWVTVVGSPEGAEVEINGQPAGGLPMTNEFRVVAGTVVVRVQAPGHETATRSLDVRPRGRSRETIHLVPRAPSDTPTEPSPTGSAPGPQVSRIYFGTPTTRNIRAELGYSAMPRVAFLLPVTSFFAFGGEAFLDLGLFNNLELPATLSVGGAMPLQLGIAPADGWGIGLDVSPGLGITTIRQPGEGVEDPSGEYFAVLIHSALNVGYDATDTISVGGGLDVPLTFFFGGGSDAPGLQDEFSVISFLLGPAVELRVAPSFVVGMELKAGPHITSGAPGSGATVDIGFKGQVVGAVAL